MTHSKFFIFASLTLLCAVESGCSSTLPLRTDPQTTETILEVTTQHAAHLTLTNGIIIQCYSVDVRQDSTRWRSSEQGEEVSMPTDSVKMIEVPNPKTGIGIALGATAGTFAGALLGFSSYTAPQPTWSNAYNGLGFSTLSGELSAAIEGSLIGLLIGGISGGLIGASDGTIWTVN